MPLPSVNPCSLQSFLQFADRSNHPSLYSEKSRIFPFSFICLFRKSSWSTCHVPGNANSEQISVSFPWHEKVTDVKHQPANKHAIVNSSEHLNAKDQTLWVENSRSEKPLRGHDLWTVTVRMNGIWPEEEWESIHDGWKTGTKTPRQKKWCFWETEKSVCLECGELGEGVIRGWTAESSLMLVTSKLLVLIVSAKETMEDFKSGNNMM